MTLRRFAGRAVAVLAGFFVLLGAVALALPRLIDVDRLRGAIASAAQQATGRSVTLGRISFGLLPAPSLTITPLAVADSAAYPGREALKADSLSIRIGILGLLRGRLALRSIVLDRPTVTLIRSSRGGWNFDDLLAPKMRAPTDNGPRVPASPPGGGSLTLTLGSASIRSGRLLLYDDAVVPGSRSEVTLGPVDASVSGWGEGKDTRFDVKVGLGKSLLHATGRLLTGEHPRLEGALDGRSILASDLVRLLPWCGVARPAGLEVGGAIDLDGRASMPLDRPESVRFQGTLRLRDLNYRDAGMSRPVKGLTGSLSIDGDRGTWNDFAVSIGGSSLKGKLSVEQFLKPRVGFNLASPRLDFNEILDTFAKPGPGTQRPPEAATAGAKGHPEAEGKGLLEQIRARGTLTVKSIRFQAFELSESRATLALESGVASLKDLQAAFYGGRLKGTAAADLAGTMPRYTFGLGMDGVAVGPLVKAYDPSLDGLLRGTLAGTLDVTASGLEMNPILASAKGTAAFEIAQGAITSFSVLKQLAALLELAGGKGIGRDETAFERLSAHFAIASGSATTDDLELRSADLDLSGKGRVGLDATMKLGAIARFSKDASRGMVDKTPRLGILTDREGRLAIHFTLDGKLTSPSFRLDTSEQMRTLQEKEKEEAKAKVLKRLKERLQKGLGQGEEKPQP